MTTINRGAGFTLIEVLVAMALLSMLMLVLGSTLRTVAQVETRMDRRTTENESVFSSTIFLRQILEQTSARRFKSLVAGQPDAVHFLGKSNQIDWIGVMPARHGAGGRYGFSLFLEQENENKKLIIKFSKILEKTQLPDTETSETRTLASQVIDFNVKYLDFEPQSQSMTWSDEWFKIDKLPSAVQIQLTTNSTTWPLFVVRLRPLTPSDRSRSIFTTGGD